MRRWTAGLLVTLGLLVSSAGVAAQSPDTTGPDQGPPSPQALRALARRNASLRKVLTKPIDFPRKEDEDLIDAKTTLGELLDVLGDRYDFQVTVDEPAFRAAAGGKAFEVMEQKVLEKPFPRMIRVSLGSVLQQILSRVPLTNNDYATFIVCRDFIEITTGGAKRARIWGENYEGPEWPLVNMQLERQPLGKALEELPTGGLNIVLNPRAARQLKTPVTATFHDAPVDTVVEILADMADLRAVLKDNVLYVTTPENTPRPAQPPDNRASPTAAPTVPLPPVSLLLERRPLNKVLEELTVYPGFNIVTDPRASRQLKTPLTANLEATQLNTAADVLADMAGLSTVLKDNVLYVTTPENALRLKQQQRQNRVPSVRPMSRVKD
jgi:hypothetical protein